MSMCRLCTKSCSRNGVLGNRIFREKVSDVICMWLDIDDSRLLTDVCGTCHKRVDEFYSFKQQCRSFQLAFKNGSETIFSDALNNSKKVFPDSGDIVNHDASTNPCSKESKCSTKNDSPSTKKVKPMKRKLENEKKHVRKCTEAVIMETQKPTSKRTTCVCELCGRKLYISRMDGHKNRHLGLEPYECHDCGDTFSCKYNLRLHWRRNHVRDEQSTCEICGKTFVSKMALRSHLIGVHGDRKFQCTMCALKFNTRYALNIHLKIHNQKRDVKCALCRKRFYSKSELNIHMRTHSGETPYKCELCSVAFVYRNMYVTHMQKNHRGASLMYLDGKRSLKNTILNKTL